MFNTAEAGLSEFGIFIYKTLKYIKPEICILLSYNKIFLALLTSALSLSAY